MLCCGGAVLLETLLWMFLMALSKSLEACAIIS